MAVRVCAEPGCPTLVRDATRCTDHTRQRERARGTRQQRGYNADHDALRAKWQRRMDRGLKVTCWRCSAPIDPSKWDLGHTDEGKAYAGPECRSCNRATASRRT
jgi:hypothetical protein